MVKPVFSRSKVRSVIRRLKSQKILVIGDVMLDEFIWGKVSRISPEAPVPVVHVTHENAYPGGAANVARNLAEFGTASSICGLIGVDEGGVRLRQLLKKEGISSTGLFAQKNVPTTIKTRIIARHQQVVRVDREKLTLISPASRQKLARFLSTTIPKIDAIIIEDYGKGFITQQLVNEVISLARKHRKVLTIDPNPNNPISWEGATVVKPNRIEAFAAMGVPQEEGMASIQKLGPMLLEKWNVKNVLITLGEEGMLLFQQGRAPYHTPTRAKEVFDVSGAGDTAIAFFTAALASGMTSAEAAEIANHAAGVVVGKLGTATLTAEELSTSLLED